MTMFFAKKLNKKGFTLAELLIVVAIIAVLVAIAVPIFTGALDRARLSVHKATARALKVMGATIILDELTDNTAVSSSDVWTVSATYNYGTEQFSTIKVEKKGEVGAHFTVDADTNKTDDLIKKIDTTGSHTYTVVLAGQDITKANN